MEMKGIIQQLVYSKAINSNKIEYKSMSGGTSSKVGILYCDGRPAYVIKMNEPRVIEPETQFLEFYRSVTRLPQVIYADPSHRYFVYDYIPGGTSYRGNNKKEILRQLVEQVIVHYRPAPDEKGWGWTDERSDSWQQFLHKEIHEAHSRVTSVLPLEDYRLVLDLAGDPARTASIERPYLLHGDFGMHNVIIFEEKLNGVIDPTPVLGPPLYDYIYAFCSSPDDLTKETLETTSRLIVSNEYEEKRMCEEVLIGLYHRIATCIKYHSYDLKAYLKAWSYWKSTVLQDA